MSGTAAFLGQLVNAAEQLTPMQRWYRILSHALRHVLSGRDATTDAPTGTDGLIQLRVENASQSTLVKRPNCRI